MGVITGSGNFFKGTLSVAEISLVYFGHAPTARGTLHLSTLGFYMPAFICPLPLYVHFTSHSRTE